MKELKRMMLDHYNVEIPEKTKILMLNMDTTSMKPFAISTDRGTFVYCAFSNVIGVGHRMLMEVKSSEGDSNKRESVVLGVETYSCIKYMLN